MTGEQGSPFMIYYYYYCLTHLNSNIKCDSYQNTFCSAHELFDGRTVFLIFHIWICSNRLESNSEHWNALLLSLRELTEWVIRKDTELSTLTLGPLRGDAASLQKQVVSVSRIDFIFIYWSRGAMAALPFHEAQNKIAVRHFPCCCRVCEWKIRLRIRSNIESVQNTNPHNNCAINIQHIKMTTVHGSERSALHVPINSRHPTSQRRNVLQNCNSSTNNRPLCTSIFEFCLIACMCVVQCAIGLHYRRSGLKS